MRKNFYAWSMAALIAASMTSCSSKEEPVQDETEYGKLAFTVNFVKSNTRADGDGGSGSTDLPGNNATGSTEVDAVSNAIPTTDWTNIQYLQIFLYDTNGIIHFSDVIDAASIQSNLNANPTSNGSVTYTYSNIPVGAYRLMAVANANSATQNISTAIAGTPTDWTAYNVVNRYIYNCRITPKAGNFPIFYQNQVAASGVVRQEVPLMCPTEIFLGQGFQNGTNPQVDVISGTTTAATISLTREVSMMRLRVNLAGDETHTNNADIRFNTDGKVDFTRNASIMIATVPDYITPMAVDRQVNGETIYAGTSGTSSQSSILLPTAGENNSMFIYSNPTTGYKEGGKIIGIDGDPYNANAWRDIMVFPNNNRQITSGADANKPLRQNRYLLILSAMGLPGHITREGELTSEKTVYWVGYINEGFMKNEIREVNIKFTDGGTQELPERPDNIGNLTITVNAPLDWSSAVKASEIEL